MPMTFDELLDSMPRGGEPMPFDSKTLGRRVYFRQPTSEDVDRYRLHCFHLQKTPGPLNAKLVQLFLCNEDGSPVVPDDPAAVAELASRQAKFIDELANFIRPYVDEPTDKDLEDAAKN